MTRHRLLFATPLLWALVGPLSADVGHVEEEPAVRDLSQLREQRPTVEPVRTPQPQPTDGPGQPNVTVEVDHAVLGVAPGQPQPRLRREGDFLLGRRGHIVQAVSGEFVFLPENPGPADPPMLLHHNQWLETLESLMAQGDDRRLFTVSGQVHVYRGANHLLLTRAEPADTAEAEAVASDEPAAADDVPDAPAGEDEAVDADAPGDDDVDRAMQELMGLRQAQPSPRPQPVESRADQRPPSPSAFAATAPRAVQGLAPGLPSPRLRREGDFLISRRGRLTRSPDGAHLLFAFEADGRAAGDPPMVLQPNRLLESMESIIASRGDGVVFLISGQVQAYRGVNYLLPTMMKLDIDRGNLQR
jgi:hypothetical protein